jgi:hypothetical protein
MQTLERIATVPEPPGGDGPTHVLPAGPAPAWSGRGPARRDVAADPSAVRAWAGRTRRYAEIGTIAVRSGLPRRWRAGSAPRQAALGRALRDACEQAGGVYVKLGQLLSTRPDLVPAGVAA